MRELGSRNGTRNLAAAAGDLAVAWRWRIWRPGPKCGGMRRDGRNLTYNGGMCPKLGIRVGMALFGESVYKSALYMRNAECKSEMGMLTQILHTPPVCAMLRGLVPGTG